MICKKCNTEFEEGIFCPECGTKYEAAEKEVTNVEQPRIYYERNTSSRPLQPIPKSEIVNEKCFSETMGNSLPHAEVDKKKIRKQKKIERSGIWSLIYGVISWVGLGTVILPFICSVLSIKKGISALVNRTKYKKCAIVGILLSLLFYALLIGIILDSSSSSTNSKPSQGDSSASTNVIEMETISESEFESSNPEDKIVSEEETPVIKEAESNIDEIEDVEENSHNIEEIHEESSEISVSITVYYEKKAFSYNDDAIIYVDGNKIGEIDAGETKAFSVILEDDTHKIWVESDTAIRQNNSGKEKFKVDDDNNSFFFHLKDGSIWGLDLEEKK